MTSELNPRSSDALTPSPECQERVIDSSTRSFNMDRKSPEAAMLRAAVSRKLLDYLGNYTDDVLAEYIIVLVCNGKNQTQARDDLYAFLGDESENFVAWLWDYLSNHICIPKAHQDSADFKMRATISHSDILNDDQKSSRHHDCQLNSEVYEISNISTNSKHSGEFQASNKLEKLCPIDSSSTEILNGGTHPHSCRVKNVMIDDKQNGMKRLLRSAIAGSAETLSGEQVTKENSSILPCQSLYISEKTPIRRNVQPVTTGYPHSGILPVRSPVLRRPSSTLDVEESQINRPRGNVWDRLGKPCQDDGALQRGNNHQHDSHGIRRQNIINPYEEEPRDSRSMLLQDSRVRVSIASKLVPSDEDSTKVITDKHLNRYEVKTSNSQGSFDGLGKSNRKRQFDEPYLGNTSMSDYGCDETYLRDRVKFPSINECFAAKHVRVNSLSKAASEPGSKGAVFAESVCASTKSSSAKPKPQSDKELQSNRNTSLNKSIQDPLSITNLTPTKPESTSSDSNIKPMQEEIRELKSKLHQVEMNMVKLRSKQTEKAYSKPNTSSGPRSQMEDDVDSRTVLVTNVHFAATREALSTHFAKCGLIAKINLLTNTITGQLKGAAFIVFVSKESVNKAISLDGTSLFSRILKVMRKPEMPPGFLTSSPKPQKPTTYHQFHKNTPPQRQYTSSHLQWKRNESAIKENSLHVTADN